MFIRKQSRIVMVSIAVFAILLPARKAAARVRLGNICTIYGQKEIHLTGIGLVVGLDGTGDGGKDAHTQRTLMTILKIFNSPVLDLKELKDAKNIAIVFISATVPKNGMYRGQKIDCYVSSIKGAKSLKGGRLLASPVETSEIGDDTMAGLAEGAIRIEEKGIETTGLIPGGIIAERDFRSPFIDTTRGNLITLLLDEAHASFPVASDVARALNEEFRIESNNAYLARAVGPNLIEVKVPQSYINSPVEFVAQALDVKIDNPQSQARVIVNAKTGVVIISEEVEISPVVITHKNLVIEVGRNNAAGGGVGSGPFVGINDPRRGVSNNRLSQLVDALNELRVPKEDVISIIRELHHSGKLHATYIER